ncbi:MAG: MFS transporter [Promethearchaeota archaeon]
MGENEETMKELLGECPDERRVVQTFGVASFLNDMGSDIIFSVWPYFVFLLSPPGLAPLILGLVDGIGDFVVNVSKGFSGFLSDKIQKRKPFIWTGYLMGASSRVIYAASPIWQWLIPAKILDRAGKLRGAPRDAIVADVSTHETRGKNFGVLRTADNTGATAGVLISLAFIVFVIPWLTLTFGFDDLSSLRFLFLFAAIPTVIGAMIVLFRIKDYRKELGKAVFHFRGINRSLAIFLTLSVLFALASFSWSLVTLYAGAFLVLPSISPILGVTVAYFVFTLTAAITSAPLGTLGDKIGRRKTMLLGFVFFGAMCAIFLFTPPPTTPPTPQETWSVLLALIFYGTSIGATVPMASSLISELSPIDVRASNLGLYQMLIGIAALPASIIAGFLWVLLGHSYTFGLALLLTVIATLMLPLVREPTGSE